MELEELRERLAQFFDFVCEEAKAQGNYVSCPKSTSRLVLEMRLEAGLLVSSLGLVPLCELAVGLAVRPHQPQSHPQKSTSPGEGGSWSPPAPALVTCVTLHKVLTLSESASTGQMETEVGPIMKRCHED